MLKEDHAERACQRAMRDLEEEILEDDRRELELNEGIEEDSEQTEHGELSEGPVGKQQCHTVLFCANASGMGFRPASFQS